MDLKTLFELLNANPAVYFIGGLVLGYLLRAYQGKETGSRTNRYKSLRTEKAGKRTEAEVFTKEPAFEWSEAAVNSMATRSLNKMSLEHGREAKV